MSYSRGISAVNFKKTDKIPRLETLKGLSAEAIKRLTGKNPYKYRVEEWFIELVKAFDVDMIWGCIPETKNVQRNIKDDISTRISADNKLAGAWGVFTTSAHVGGKLFDTNVQSPEDAIKFKPLSFFKESSAQLVEQYSNEHINTKKHVGNRAVVVGHFYHTLFHWMISCFNWENFMIAAAMDENKFKRIIDEFAELSCRHIKAWSEVDGLEVFISHDDIAITRGLVFRPDWYRKYILPWYPIVWAPLKKKGIKIIYVSDGNYSELVEDIAEAGADGFIFEPLVDLQMMVDKFGGSKILIGNIDTKILTFGSKDDITNEVNRVIDVAGRCPGFFINASGGLPQNIPLENLLHYLKLSESKRKMDEKI